MLSDGILVVMLVPAARLPNVAFVLPALGAGGSEHIVSLLCNHFAAQGWAVTLISFEDEGNPPYYSHHKDVRILCLGMKPRRRAVPVGAMATLWRQQLLNRTLKDLVPDLVVSFLTRTNIHSVLAARALGIPVVISERNNPAFQTVGKVWGLLRKWTYPRASGLVTMTQGAMDYFQSRMDVRGWVIPNPAPTPKKSESLTSDGRTIGAVGRLVPQKGFDLLIDAFALVADRIPDWRLVIWGEGPERTSLEAQCARLGLADRVRLPGVTCRPGEWASETDLFVLSSRFEGWGIVVGEAMAAGLPVISFDCRWGPSEMIEHGRSGLLVPNGDVEALSEAIVKLCKDEARRNALSVEARERMALFGLDRILADWQRVLTEVLEGRRVGACSGGHSLSSRRQKAPISRDADRDLLGQHR